MQTKTAEDYVHRIGRTGRAGASGDAITLMSPAEERQIADIEKLMKKPLPRQPLAVRGGARRDDDEEERGARGPRGHGAMRDGPRGGQRAHRPAPIDDWFSKPYEPPANLDTATPAATVPAARPGLTTRKPAVGALLGGGRKKTTA